MESILDWYTEEGWLIYDEGIRSYQKQSRVPLP